ncbi:NIPSNAP family protein [Streptomyces sp. V4I8]|uniref:NIPSNAP family protein n=1 Tax=Streptomyces sp. V4I8 TaxID=3156469 RepID=UPI0035157CA8
MSLLEVRMFTVQPGRRGEFDRISRDSTIPMMRRWGIDVVSYGPALNDEDGYVLLRVFASEEERVGVQERFYASEEWTENYEKPVMEMIADYRTAVLPLDTAPRERLGR